MVGEILTMLPERRRARPPGIGRVMSSAVGLHRAKQNLNMKGIATRACATAPEAVPDKICYQ
jgi:hypothetical protein